MKTYRVARQCHGFKKRMWFPGQIVVLDDSEQPPYHFELVPNDTVVVPKIEEPEKPYPLSKLSETPKVVGGFGASIEQQVPVPEPIKRGRPKK